MELEKIKEEEKGLEEYQANDLFMSIVMGKDATEIVDTSKGKFKIKFPRIRDLEEIGRRTAFRLNGLPAKCFDFNTYSLIQQIATLDVIVIDGPGWFKKAKDKNIDFSWEDIPSLDLIREVYAKAYNFREEVQNKFEENPKPKAARLDDSAISDNDTQSGLFEGLSGETGTNG